MTRIAHPIALFVLVSLGLALGASGPCGAEAPPSRGPAVVELYTSQGCSSCPPADALLGELVERPDVIAIAFHVAYWDGPEWHDRFALPAATERQQRYVETLGLSSAFTPQAVVDGRRSFVGSDRRRILAALAEPRETIPLAVDASAGTLTVILPPAPDQTAYDVNLIAYLPRAATRVGGGENSGRALEEFNIARQFRRLGVWNGERHVFSTPLDSFPQDATRVAVLLQRPGQGPIAGAALIAIR